MDFLPICRRAASLPHPLCPWVLRAIPDKCCGARRGKREKSALLRNVSELDGKWQKRQRPKVGVNANTPCAHFRKSPLVKAFGIGNN